jgi:hypothetical protein
MTRALREKDPDRIGPRGPAPLKNASEDRGEKNASVPHGPPAPPSRWLKPIADYERRERREYQVSRFG